MFDNTKNIRPVLFDNLDAIFDEKGSTFLAMRKVQWCGDTDKPDIAKAKLELRKWRISKEGEERADKGFSFLTEEGPHELAKTLVSNGYGHTKDIIREIVKRKDFKESINTINQSDDKADGEYFDMRSALLNISNEILNGDDDEND